MRNSYLVRRIFAIVVLGVFLTVALTTITYTFLSQTIFTQLRENELTPKAKALGELVRMYIDEEIDQDTIRQIVAAGSEPDSNLLGAYALVLNDEGGIMFASPGITDDYYKLIKKEFVSMMQGKTVTTPRRLQMVQANVVMVGTPVYSAAGEFISAVVLMVPMVEIIAAIGSMNGALVFSMSIVLPIIGVVSYILAKRISKPLRQMNKVALSMAGGSFSERADSNQGGEIGELARSINFLARELSVTIADLTLERNRLRDVIDGLSEGILAVDRGGEVTHTNRALAELFSGSRALSDGSLHSTRLGLVPFPEVWDDIDSVLGGSEPAERTLELKDRILRIRITPLRDEHGSVAGAVGLIVDITSSELLEKTRREFVANVSHELRTPLTAMRGLVEPMRDGLVKTEEARQRYLDIILRETMRLSRLINDLMELSRLQSGNLSMECSPVRMSVMFADLQEKYLPTAEDHDLSFRLTFDPQHSPVVWTNADRVEEVLVILLDNAIKYTPEGGTVTLSSSVQGDRLRISVTDTGVGISEEDQKHVFDRFYKVDKAHTTKGSGLGLSIAKEMLQRLGSDLTLRSEEGKGSTFSFSLPLNRPL
ncbi:MAG: HAMP domain-containing protein [Clostridia bacterium]|nr:HAMP domain-containing protein [Clostridia bacterium]